MKIFVTSLWIAFRALRVNKLRSALTVLGIVIGIASVVAMVAIGEGAQAQIEQEIASLGANMIVVQPGSLNIGGVRLGWGNAVTLTRDDAEAIAAQLPIVTAVAPARRGNAQIIAGKNNWYTRIFGTTPEYFSVRNIQIKLGSPFTATDDASVAKVALLGQTVVDRLFGPGVNPVGQGIRINHVPFIVLGTLVPKGQSAFGEDQDDTILVPLSTAQRRVLGRNPIYAKSVSQIYVQARSAELTQAVEQQVADLIRYRHRIGPGKQDDFQVRSLASRYQSQQESSEVMSILLASIAAVSLLVGGIGVMNIMLVSVTERTNEIGLRQALGAKTKHILGQFLTEAVALSIAGGLLGILLGLTASIVISRISDWPTRISPVSILIAFLSAACVGIFFGYYPARMAARLNPIDAIRHE